ncbi:hypothetical protein Tco_1371341 [Tanacetum coccineum]
MMREWMAWQMETNEHMKNQVVELEQKINQRSRNRQAIIKNLERQFAYLEKIYPIESLPRTINTKPRHEFAYKPPLIRNENDKGDVKFIEEDEIEPIPTMPNPNPINSNSPTEFKSIDGVGIGRMPKIKKNDMAGNGGGCLEVMSIDLTRLCKHLRSIYHMEIDRDFSGPDVWPRKYSELTPADAIQADCDVKATNIILQGLSPEERECKLYDEFDKFAYKKGETLHDFYLRFSLLLNDINIYNVKLEQFQVNTKFLNTLPLKWSKFVTNVKLAWDLHKTNIDQLHAYLGQHEFHANEVRLMHERNSDPLALVATHQMTLSPYQTHQNSYQDSQFQPQVSLYQSPQYGSLYQS